MQGGRLKRQLSLLDLTFLGLGAIIGSGWLYASQKAAVLAGPSAWIAWIVGAVAVGLIGLVYAELGSALPRAGGIIRYPDYSHGPITGFLMGIAALVAYSSVASIEVEAVRGYAQQWWPAIGTASGNPTVLGWIVQLALLVFFFLLNYWSVNIFGKFNSLITALKFIVPALTIILFFFQFKMSNFHSHGFAIGHFTGIEQAVSTSGIIFAFLGFRQAIDFAGEARNPQRSVPFSIILAITIGAVLYVLLQVVFVGAIPESALKGGWTSLAYNAPFADLATLLGMGWLSFILFADAVVSPAGTANIYLSSTARVVFAWARTGTFPKPFTKISSSGVPRVALWFYLLLAVFWTLPFPTWNFMVNVVSSATVMTYVIGPISAMAFRKTAPNLHRPFRLGGMSFIAPIAFIIASLIIYWTGWQTDYWLIGLQIVMFFVYLIIAAVSPLKNKDGLSLATQVKSSLWLVVYYIAMLLISYFGDTNFGGIGKIPSPWDQIALIIVSLIAFYWGLASALKKPNLDQESPEEDADGVVSSL